MTTQDLSRPVDIAFKAVICVLLVADLIGNGLVILVILSCRRLKTPMNFLLVNLALADIMVAVFLAPIYVVSGISHPEGETGDTLCKLVTGGNLAWVGGLTSVFSLVFIAIERYYAVLHPFNVQDKITPGKVRFFITVSWFTAVLCEIPEMVFDCYQPESVLRCKEVWPNDWLPVVYGVFWLIMAGVFPVTMMVFLYYKISRSLWLDDGAYGSQFSRHVVTRSRTKLTKMMITVSVVFSLCWLPVLAVYIIRNVRPGLIVHEDIAVRFCYGLVAFNSSFNPFLYTLQFDKFKGQLRKLCCSWRQSSHELRRRSTRESLFHDRVMGFQGGIQNTAL